MSEPARGGGLPTRFAAFLVEAPDHGSVCRRWTEVSSTNLPPGEVVIRVAWSSLNYKDALAAEGNRGVVRQFPHVPGIDAAGEVVASQSERYTPGQPVLVTGYELGSGQWGGWAEYIRVPAAWVVPRPSQLSARQAMALGTAGFTAAQCVRELIRNEIDPQRGPIVVTGATGGVGSLAIQLLSQLGYRAVAVTGKRDADPWLRSLGAAEVLDRTAVTSTSDRPLLSARWAGGIDTVGGSMLTTMLRCVEPYGCVAACGLVGGSELAMTVFPFILRGVKLAGVSSALCGHATRLSIWDALAGPWRPEHLERTAQVIERHELEVNVRAILAGQITGRRILRIAVP